MNREIRLYRYLCQLPGWNPRDRLMHWTDFPDPKRHPVIAYVEFQNAVMRLNSRLHREGKQIVRDGTNELYRIVSIETKAA